MRYRAIYVAPNGAEIERDYFEYDVAAHESFPSLIPEAHIMLTLDAPGFSGKARSHIDGTIEPVVINPKLLVVCDEDFRGKYDIPVPTGGDVGVVIGEAHRELIEREGYPFTGPLVIVSPA